MSAISPEQTAGPATQNSSRPVVWSLVGLFIGAAFLWIALRHTDWPSVVSALQQANVGWVAACLVAALGFSLVKAWRWIIILDCSRGADPNRPAYYRLALRLVFAGTAANLVVAHTGEFVRARVLARHIERPTVTVLAAIANERLLDFLSLLIFICMALVIDPQTSALLKTAGLVSLALVLTGIALLVAVFVGNNHTRQVLLWILAFLPTSVGNWLTGRAKDGKDGLELFKSPRAIGTTLLVSLFQWFWIVLAVWFSMFSVGIDVSFSTAIVVFTLTVIGLTLPSAPAQLGTLQLAFVAGLQLSETTPGTDFAASLIYTVFVNGPMLLLGTIFLMALWAKRKKKK